MQGAETVIFRGATISALTTPLLDGEVFLSHVKGKGLNAAPEQRNEECSMDYLAGGKITCPKPQTTFSLPKDLSELLLLLFTLY